MQIFDYTLRQHKFRENQKVFVFLHLTNERANTIFVDRSFNIYPIILHYRMQQ